MLMSLPAPIARYFDARNVFDIEAILASFAEEAIVEDENEEHRGRVAIRAWIEETTRKYHATAEPREANTVGDTFVVSALVTGDFPGSPIVLDHACTLSSDAIVRLEIG
jgi:ketosteroid isomerase-like protein